MLQQTVVLCLTASIHKAHVAFGAILGAILDGGTCKAEHSTGRPSSAVFRGSKSCNRASEESRMQQSVILLCLGFLRRDSSY